MFSVYPKSAWKPAKNNAFNLIKIARGLRLLQMNLFMFVVLCDRFQYFFVLKTTIIMIIIDTRIKGIILVWVWCFLVYNSLKCIKFQSKFIFDRLFNCDDKLFFILWYLHVTIIANIILNFNVKWLIILYKLYFLFFK